MVVVLDEDIAKLLNTYEVATTQKETINLCEDITSFKSSGLKKLVGEVLAEGESIF